jgi:hypothetical protein
LGKISLSCDALRRNLAFLGFMSYSLPSIEIDIKTQELALRRGAPQRLISHWEGSNTLGDSHIVQKDYKKKLNLSINQ